MPFDYRSAAFDSLPVPLLTTPVDTMSINVPPSWRLTVGAVGRGLGHRFPFYGSHLATEVLDLAMAIVSVAVNGMTHDGLVGVPARIRG